MYAAQKCHNLTERLLLCTKYHAINSSMRLISIHFSRRRIRSERSTQAFSLIKLLDAGKVWYNDASLRPLTIFKPLLYAEQGGRKMVLNVFDSFTRISCHLTLRPDEDQGDILHVTVLRHLGVVIVDGVEARLVLETEHEDHRVDPRSELKQNETGRKKRWPQN